MKKEIANNTFNQGMVLDFNELVTPNNVLTNCLNGTLITFQGNENILQNDMGNARVHSAQLPSGYVPLGTCELGGIVYIVSYNPLENLCQVGSFPSPLRIHVNQDETESWINSSLFSRLIEGETCITKSSQLISLVPNMHPGDKFIIQLDTKNSLNWNVISDFNKPDKSNVRLSLVTVNKDGSIKPIENIKEYKTGNSKHFLFPYKENKSNLANFRDLISSEYSVYDFQEVGTLCILAELEVINSFSYVYYLNKVSENKYNISFLTEWSYKNSINDTDVKPDLLEAFITTNTTLVSSDLTTRASIDSNTRLVKLNDPLIGDKNSDIVYDFTITPYMKDFGKLLELQSSFSLSSKAIASSEIKIIKWQYKLEDELFKLTLGLLAYISYDKRFKDCRVYFKDYYPNYTNSVEVLQQNTATTKSDIFGDFAIEGFLLNLTAGGQVEKTIENLNINNLSICLIVITLNDNTKLYFYRLVYPNKIANKYYRLNSLIRTRNHISESVDIKDFANLYFSDVVDILVNSSSNTNIFYKNTKYGSYDEVTFTEKDPRLYKQESLYQLDEYSVHYNETFAFEIPQLSDFKLYANKLKLNRTIQFPNLKAIGGYMTIDCVSDLDTEIDSNNNTISDSFNFNTYTPFIPNYGETNPHSCIAEKITSSIENWDLVYNDVHNDASNIFTMRRNGTAIGPFICSRSNSNSHQNLDDYSIEFYKVIPNDLNSDIVIATITDKVENPIGNTNYQNDLYWDSRPNIGLSIFNDTILCYVLKYKEGSKNIFTIPNYSKTYNNLEKAMLDAKEVRKRFDDLNFIKLRFGGNILTINSVIHYLNYNAYLTTSIQDGEYQLLMNGVSLPDINNFKVNVSITKTITNLFPVQSSRATELETNGDVLALYNDNGVNRICNIKDYTLSSEAIEGIYQYQDGLLCLADSSDYKSMNKDLLIYNGTLSCTHNPRSDRNFTHNISFISLDSNNTAYNRNPISLIVKTDGSII